MAGFVLIEDVVLGSAATSIVFNTGLTDYTKFRLTLYVIKDGTSGSPMLRLNGDTGGNYAIQRLSASGTSVVAERLTGQTFAQFSRSSALAANQSHMFTLEISKPITGVPARINTLGAYMDTAGPSILFESLVNEWNNTADAISSISILSSSGNFAAGTRAVLEGLSLADSITPSPVTFTWTIVAPSIALGASALVYQGSYTPQIVKKNVG